MPKLTREMLERLKRIEWKRYGVCHVLLIGSLASRGSGSDIDLLVFPCNPRQSLDLETLAGLLEAAIEAARRRWSYGDAAEALQHRSRDDRKARQAQQHR